MHLHHRVPFIPLLQLLLHFSGFIRIGSASEFGTSDIYTASIVAARNNIPVLLFRDAQCKFCPKVEDFLVGLGAKYQTFYIGNSNKTALQLLQSSAGKYEQLIFPCIVLGGQFYDCGEALVSLYYSGSLSASLAAAGAQIRESQHINQAPYIDVLQSFASYPYSGRGYDDIVAAGAVLVKPVGLLTVSNLKLFNMYGLLYAMDPVSDGPLPIATTTASVVAYFEKQKSRSADSSVEIPKMETFGSVYNKLWSSTADLSFPNASFDFVASHILQESDGCYTPQNALRFEIWSNNPLYSSVPIAFDDVDVKNWVSAKCAAQQKGSRDITEERFQLIKPFNAISSSAVIQLQSLKQLDEPVKLQVSLNYRQSWRAIVEVGRVTTLMGLQIVDVDAFSQRMTLTIVADAGIKIGFLKFPPASVTVLNGAKVPGLTQSVVLQGQMVLLQALLSELIVEGASAGTGHITFTIDDGGGTGISELPSLNSTFALQVIVMEISQNLAPKIVLSRTSMIERPAAFQMLPFMELSDPDAGWSNVTVTLLVQPSNPQLQAPMSSFKYKRWSPWDMPQATDVSIRHVGFPGYIYRKADCRDFGMPPVSVSVEGPNSDGIFVSNMLYRDVTVEFKRTDVLSGDVGRKDAVVHFINANGPVLLQYHVSATCKVLLHVMTRQNWVYYRDGNSIYSRDEGASMPSSYQHHLYEYVLGNDLPVEWIIAVEQSVKNISCNVTWVVFSRPAKMPNSTLSLFGVSSLYQLSASQVCSLVLRPPDQGYLSTPESRVDIIPVNSVGLNGSSSIRFTGPLDAVNNVVRDVAVAAQPSGSWLISVVLSDNGHSGAGGSLSFTAYINLNISGNSTWDPSTVIVSAPHRWIVGRPAVVLRGSSTSLADVSISNPPVFDAVVEVTITPPAPAYSIYVDLDLVPDAWARAAFSSVFSSFVVLRGPSRVINSVMHAIFIRAEKLDVVADGIVTVLIVDQGLQTVSNLVVAQTWNLPTLGPQFIKHFPGATRAVAGGSSVRATALSIDFPINVGQESGILKMAVSQGRLAVGTNADVSIETRGSLSFLSSYLASVSYMPPAVACNVTFTISMSYQFTDGFGASTVARSLFLEPLYQTRTALYNETIVVGSTSLNAQPSISLSLSVVPAGGVVFPFAAAVLSDDDVGADTMTLVGSCSCGIFVQPRVQGMLPESSAQIFSGQNSSFVISGPLNDVQHTFRSLGMFSDISCKSIITIIFSDSGGPSRQVIGKTAMTTEMVFSFGGVLSPPALNVPYPTEAVIIGLAVPPLSQNGRSIVKTSGVKSVWATTYDSISTRQGLGMLLNADPRDILLPLQPTMRAFDTAQPIISEGNQDDWVLHDTSLVAPLIPDPLLARIDFVFSHQVILTSITLIQTKYAITSVEVLIGNSDDSMVSLGIVFTPASIPYVDGQMHIFLFSNNSVFASRMRVIFRSISSYRGWAIYRAFPRYLTPLHQVGDQAVIPRLLINTCGKEIPLSKLDVNLPDEGVDASSDPSLSKSQNILKLVIRTSKGAFFLSTMPGEVTDGNAMSSSYVTVQARAGRIRAMLQSLRYTSPHLPNIVGTRENIASLGALVHDELTLVVTYPNKNASGTLRSLKDSALIEITSLPDTVGYRGEQPTPRSLPKECLPCYELDPTDTNVCIHQELYYGDPRASGHSYKRSSFDMYSEAQRLEWRARYYKSCLEPLGARYVTNEVASGGGFGTVLEYGDESSKPRESV